MKKCLFFAVAILCAGGVSAREPGSGPQPTLYAAAPADKNKPDQPPAAAQSEAAKKAQPAPSAKQVEQDNEEAGVLIDSKPEDAEGEDLPPASAYKDDPERLEEMARASYLPSAYGQLKGILNEQGRNVLVFENDDGVLSFVQVTVGKRSVAWKLLARIARSQD